jgi:hypothetical protein
MPASMSDPAESFAAVTPGDTTASNFTKTARALYVGTAGDVAVVPKSGGTAVVFAAVPGGTILPVECVRVNADGTDADDIVALF